MIIGQIQKHIEPESIFLLALDEKARTIPRTTRAQFLEHISMCESCTSIFDEAKGDVRYLEEPGKREFAVAHQVRPTLVGSWWTPASVVAIGVFLLFGVGYIVFIAVQRLPSTLRSASTSQTQVSNTLRPSNLDRNVSSNPTAPRDKAPYGMQNVVASENKNAVRIGRHTRSRSQATTVREVVPLYVLNDANGLVIVNSDGGSQGLSAYDESVRRRIARTLLKGPAEYAQVPRTKSRQAIQAGNIVGSVRPWSPIVDAAVGFTNIIRPTFRPNGGVLRTDQPTFTWPGLNFAKSYDITVLDVSAEPRAVATAREVDATTWKFSTPLPRGRVYSWKLSANRDAKPEQLPIVEVGQLRFKILDDRSEVELRKVETVEPRSHLALGLLYARAGLFRDARREFQQLVKLNPKSKKAQELLKEVDDRSRP